jgi:putative PIN family toxin of toxin-antitoxin system
LNLLENRGMKKASKSYKVIIDSNIWISFLIGKSLKGLQNHLNSDDIIIATCDEQIQELVDVFKKPKIKKHLSQEQVDDFMELLVESSEKVKLKTKSNICRDSKDNYLVSLSIDSKANYLITGDLDLLELKQIGITKILKYSDFQKIFDL